MANDWSSKGEIPKEWVDSVDPRPVHQSEPGFGSAVAWQKVMAILAWFFSGLFIISIVFELTGIL